jgi:hypothetical protein
MSTFPHKILTVLTTFLFLSINCNSNTSEKASQQEMLGDALVLSSLFSSNRGTCKSTGQFWARSLGKEQYSYCLNASLVASTQNLNIHLESDLTTNLNYLQVANEFEDKILPTKISFIGSSSDINRDGKIDLLILK